MAKSEWKKLDQNLRAEGINLKWIGNDDRVFHIGGQLAGAEGVLAVPPIRGMVHVPFKQIWHEPAYGPPRYERTIDERREIGIRLATMVDDSRFGWFDVEARLWAGMDGHKPGWFCVSTRKFGEMYIPCLLLETPETELDEDPALDGCMVWDVVLAADGDPRWRQPDLKPRPWVTDMSTTTTVKYDESIIATDITVGVGKFKLANRSTTDQWPVYTLTAQKDVQLPVRYWISNGGSPQMIRVPPLFQGEHIIVDTNPENRIAVSALDPVDTWVTRLIGNGGLLAWLFGEYGQAAVPILERFHGQGFNQPLQARTVSTVTVYCDTPGMRVGVRLPQRFERPIS